jgi:crotonobetainyl-CoA:carnitine CoA-transferase CaiB-like acyl-CoA transferase
MSAQSNRPMQGGRGGPLAGTRVVDLTIWLSGPIAGSLLGDLGAEVVKVESLRGDPTRDHVSFGAGADKKTGKQSDFIYRIANRNKHSVALDLEAAGDRALFDSLIASADVFVTNLSPRTLRKLGLTPPDVQRLNQRIVYGRVAGFGQVGPRSDEPAQDMLGMAYSGLLTTLSGADGHPYLPPGSVNDLLAGTHLAFGILAALRQRDLDGKAQVVGTSLVQTPLWLQAMLVGSLANTVDSTATVTPTGDPKNALINQYLAADDQYIAFALLGARQWLDLTNALELVDLPGGLSTFADSVSHPVEMAAELQERVRAKGSEYWLERLRAAGIWCSPVNRLEDVLSDRHIAANEYLTTLDDGSVAVSMPFSLDGYDPPVRAGGALDSGREELGL